jgi:hypothetical protein
MILGRLSLLASSGHSHTGASGAEALPVDIEKNFDLFRLNLHRPGKLADHLIHGN